MGNRRLYNRTGRSVTGAETVLAREDCQVCLGFGRTRGGEVCACVDRKAFTDVMDRADKIGESQRASGPILRQGRYSRPPEEFLADVIATARKTLTADQFAVFDLHHLKKFTWHACSRILGFRDRGVFFHELYRVQAILGSAFRDAALHPVRDYLSLTTTGSQ
jgi:hypothetical protein